MIVEFRIKADVDTGRWSEMFDTDGQLASDVKRDMRTYVREIVLEQLDEDGLLIGDISDQVFPQ